METSRSPQRSELDTYGTWPANTTKNSESSLASSENLTNLLWIKSSTRSTTIKIQKLKAKTKVPKLSGTSSTARELSASFGTSELPSWLYTLWLWAPMCKCLY